MSAPMAFLHALGHALIVTSLYPEAHPSRGKALLELQAAIERLVAGGPTVRAFTFLGGEVVYGREPLRELRRWDLAIALATAGLERIELSGPVSAGDAAAFIEAVAHRLAADAPSVPTPIRCGALHAGAVVHAIEAAVAGRVAGERSGAPGGPAMDDEMEACAWVQQLAASGERLSRVEADAVVRALAAGMRDGRTLTLPQVRAAGLEHYPTAHALNVSILSMGLAEVLGYEWRLVHEIGLAGLLYDIGMARVPVDVRLKPEALTSEEWALVHRHPLDGARALLGGDGDFDMATLAAYEHHLTHDGGGYPVVAVPRPCAPVSRIVRVCDAYDALCSARPHRAAWTPAQALAMLRAGAGSSFDPDVVRAFDGLLERAAPLVGAATPA